MIRLFSEGEGCFGRRNYFIDGFPALQENKDLLEALVSSSFPELYNHIISIMNMNLGEYFSDSIMSIFISNLESKSLRTAVHIFDVYLVDGE
jgi:hypothetical protein